MVFVTYDPVPILGHVEVHTLPHLLEHVGIVADEGLVLHIVVQLVTTKTPTEQYRY